MNITFYNCTCDNAYLDKSNYITEIATDTCIIKQNIDMTNPEITVKYNELIEHANYMYIADYDRYYFIDNPVLRIGNMMSFHGTVDPLFSHMDSIRNLNVIAERSNGQTTYLHDDMYKPLSAIDTQIINFNNGFYFDSTSKCYVLQVLGGVQS